MESKTRTFRIIEIDWKKEDPTKSEKAGCLYCVYGDSPIYGKDALLYIGYTERTVTERMLEHDQNDEFGRINNRIIRVGTLGNIGGEITEKLLKTVESLLITMTKPSYNSENIKNIDHRLCLSGALYLILNKGDRGALPLEISNIWWHHE